jgi:hypothetical protein
MALMAANGDIEPMPDCAIFADTQCEPKETYEYLGFLVESLPFPIHRVTVGNLYEDVMRGLNSTGQRFDAIPWFTLTPDGSKGMGKRECTKQYKMVPIQRKLRELLGGKTKPGDVLMWIGISRDEASRMKDSQVKYIVNRWPLALEKYMTRGDCIQWLTRHGYPIPPKSACIMCPYHTNAQWRSMMEDPARWDAIRALDVKIRHTVRFVGQRFMHPSCLPVNKVDFSTDEDRGQLNMFQNECEGMCGV